MNRKIVWILALLVAAALTFGCKKSEESATDTSTTSVSMTDTSATTSTTGTTDTTGTGSSGGTVSSLSDSDKTFVTKSAQAGMAEVAAGSMAAQKATNADVKNFANRMVNDHGKANDELKGLATNKGMALPSETDAEHKAAADKLAAQSGAAFDKAYMAQMVKDHEAAVSDFDKASKNAGDPDLKNWASKTLPTLQDHLKMAKDISSKLK
jgi:putative membrane protein